MFKIKNIILLLNSSLLREAYKGQESIKRCMEIAAAGGHNIILIGPPGSGKTMLAKRLPSILPPLSLNEALETTKIHSVAGRTMKTGGVMTSRPFRSPHHTINGVTPICSSPISAIKIKAKKPCYLPLPCENDTSLGAELKRRRLALEWTQRDCANYFKVLKDSYQKWEWNQIIPDIKKRKTINRFLTFNYWNNGSNSLANRVLLYRIEYQIYRTELGEILKISSSTIERIEKGDSMVSIEMANMINNYLVKYEDNL